MRVAYYESSVWKIVIVATNRRGQHPLRARRLAYMKPQAIRLHQKQDDQPPENMDHGFLLYINVYVPVINIYIYINIDTSSLV